MKDSFHSAANNTLDAAKAMLIQKVSRRARARDMKRLALAGGEAWERATLLKQSCLAYGRSFERSALLRIAGATVLPIELFDQTLSMATSQMNGWLLLESSFFYANGSLFSDYRNTGSTSISVTSRIWCR